MSEVPPAPRRLPSLDLLRGLTVLGMIVEEAVVQDGYMNALTDGFGNGNGAG